MQLGLHAMAQNGAELVRQTLEYMRRYRATVAIDPAAKCIITDQMIATELARWQFFGQVTDTPAGYQIEAQFLGKTGTYTLPEQVETCEIIG
jgi:hypothetical protein